MTDRELMQQALEALMDAQLHNYALKHKETDDLITALRERLAQPEHEQALLDAITGGTGVMLGGKRIDPASIYKEPEQEPVVGEYATCLEDGERVLIASVLPVGYGGNKTRTVRVVWSDGTDGVYTLFQFAKLFAPLNTPTTPPRREWVGLTDDEIAVICGECAASAHRTDDISYARAIEAKLKEKNQ